MKTLDEPIALGRTAEIYAWDEGTILKLYRDWCPPDWADYEARVARVVELAGIPSPKVGEIVEIDGRRGVIYERVDGPSLLRSIGRKPFKMLAYARILAQLHVAMHNSPAPALPAQRANLIRSIQSAQTLPDALRQKVLARLDELPDGDRLCHGDFHPDNVLLTSRGPLVIDWMTASQGSPAADVARTRLLLTLGEPLATGFERALILLARWFFVEGYYRHYRRGAPEIFRQSQAFLPIMAAARLNEDIAPEREKLLKLIAGWAA